MQSFRVERRENLMVGISRPGGQAAVINRCWFLECKSDNVSDTWMSSRGQKLQSAMGVRLGLGGKSASLT
jgi:hypothetical protein